MSSRITPYLHSAKLLKKLALPFAVAAITAGATHAFGALSLTNIPTIGSDTSNEGRAITPDGKYIGGPSGTADGYFYDVANNFVTRPLAGSFPTVITGIGYRTDTNQVPPVVQVILDGDNSGYHAQFETSDGGHTWGAKRRDNGNVQYAYSTFVSPVANSLAAWTNSDIYYVTWRNSGKTAIYTCQGSNLWNGSTAALTNIIPKTVSGSDKVFVNGVAATGRIVGYRFDGASATNRNNLWDWPPSSGTSFQWIGLDGTLAGEAWSVSQDGTIIFGRSPITPGDTNLYAYRAVVTAAPSPSRTSIGALPEIPNVGGSVTRAVPYGCTADGKYAVGMNYPGTTTAVLWDTTDPNPANWRVSDLTALALANGVADIFTRLVKAYSVGTNTAGDPMVTGYGVDASLNTRAFVMTVPRWIAAIQFPGNTTKNYGTTATFSLATNGTDSLTYQWYKNGVPLSNSGNVSGVTTTTLTLTGVTCPGGDAGSYQVVISNASISGVVTGAMTLTVNDPIITLQPVSQTNLVGTTVTFTVNASGSSTVSYQWERGGGVLTDGPTGFGSTIAGATTATLTISNVTVADAANGNYTVVVSDSGSCAVTSAARTLTVLAPPVLSSVTASAGSYTLSISGPAGQTYKVKMSTDVTLPLASWTTLTSGTFSGGNDTYLDPSPADPQRFYRIVSP